MEEANATGMSGSAETLSGFSVYVEAPENRGGGEIFCVIVYQERIKGTEKTSLIHTLFHR